MRFVKRIEFKYGVFFRCQEMEKLQLEKKRQQKVDTKQFLFQQMDDKEKKNQLEKVKDQEQVFDVMLIVGYYMESR